MTLNGALPLHLEDETATVRLGAALAPFLGLGDVVCLSGPLGAGKTTVIRGLIQALQAPFGRSETVTSPTFNLVQIYQAGPLSVWHFDLYRVEHAYELTELGFEAALEEGLTLVEWPDRLGAHTPPDRLEIRLSDATPHSREAVLRGHGAWDDRLSSLEADLWAALGRMGPGPGS